MSPPEPRYVVVGGGVQQPQGPEATKGTGMSNQEAASEQAIAGAVAHIIDSLHELGEVNAVNGIFLRVDPDKLTPVIAAAMGDARERGASLWEAEMNRRYVERDRSTLLVRVTDFDRVQKERAEFEQRALLAERRVEQLRDAVSEMAEQIRKVSTIAPLQSASSATR